MRHSASPQTIDCVNIIGRGTGRCGDARFFIKSRRDVLPFPINKNMKLRELSPETLIRNSIGRVITPKMIISTLKRLFNHTFTLEQVIPFVRSFNVAMGDIDPGDSETAATNLWARLDAELSHQNKRPLPVE